MPCLPSSAARPENLAPILLLIDAEGKEVSTLKTDIFGDFWFERCVPGKYSVKIEMAGYTTKTISDIDATEKDINIGSIDLAK